MTTRPFLLFFALLAGCTAAQREAIRPARLGVSVGVGQTFAGAQGTTVSVAIIPQWDIPKPSPASKVAGNTTCPDPR